MAEKIIKDSGIRKFIFILSTIFKSGKISAYNVLFIKLLQVIFLPFDWLISKIERKPSRSEQEKDLPVIFVLGIQRTGSTIVSQFIADTFPFFPVGNFSTLFRKASYLPYKLFAHLYKQGRKKNYKNFYGISTGIFTIGDAYEFWDQWFGKDHYNVPEEISEDEIQSLRNHLTDIYRACQKPLITKNNRNSLLLESFYRIFPNAFFIIVDREPLPLIRSTIRASKDFFGAGKHLWGLKPYPDFDPGKFENITEAATVQYLELNKQIKRQAEQIPKDAYIQINYEDFCDAPKDVQQKIIDKISLKYSIKKEDVELKDPGFKTSRRLTDNKTDREINFYLNKWKNKQFA